MQGFLFFLSEFNMKPFQKSNIILDIVVFRAGELYLKNIIPPDPQQKEALQDFPLHWGLYVFMIFGGGSRSTRLVTI